MSDLHVETHGNGTPAVFVHGSFRRGLDTFGKQVALADEFRVIIVDRRGYADSAINDSDGWPTDMHDLAAVLDEIGPAHVVGHSYGAVVALLAAALRPELVLSLVAIEPPAFELARGDPDADATTAATKPVYERARELTTAEFVTEWGRSRGMNANRLAAWTDSFGEQEWDAAEATHRERWPGDAPIDLDVLARACFPKVVVAGAYSPEVVGRPGLGRDLAAVCHVVADGIGARLAVFERSTHNAQREEPEAFNRLLRELWHP